jgi:hypothetical protein
MTWRAVRSCSVQSDLRREGHRSSWFADDGLGGAADRAWAQQGERRCSELMRFYGFREALDKGQGNVAAGQPPVSQQVHHLGLDLDFAPQYGLFSVPTRKALAIQRLAKSILCEAKRERRWVRRRKVQRYYSLLLSVMQADTEAMFRCRCLIECCKRTGCFRGRRGNWRGGMKLDSYAMAEVRWGSQYLSVPRGRTAPPAGRNVWHKPVTQVMSTDASKDPAPPPTRLERLMDGGHVPAPSVHAGWGVVHFPGGGPNHAVDTSPTEQAAILARKGAFAPQRWPHTRVAHGVFSPAESQNIIAVLEMRAVRHGVRFAGELLRDSTCLLWEDNMNCAAVIQRMRSKSPQLHREYALLHAELAALNCRLIARWIRSADQPSDFWTRLQYRSDWQLSARIRAMLFEKWGVPEIDRFAQPHDAVVKRFNCPYPHPAMEALDAFTQVWAGQLNWINPPWAYIGRVLQKLQAEPTAAAIVVVPCFWARWFPALMALATDAVELPCGPEDIIPGPVAAASPEPLRSNSWRLAAYFVPSGVTARASRRPIIATAAG